MYLSRKKIRITSKSLFFCLLALLWTKDIGVRFAESTLRRVPYAGDVLIAFIITLPVVFLILGSVGYISKYIKLQDILFYFSFCAVYLISYFTTDYHNVSEYLSENAYQILCVNVPCLFIGLALRDEIPIRLLYKVSLMSIILSGLSVLIMGASHFGLDIGIDAMSMAYGLLPHLLLVYSFFVKKPSLLRLTFVVVGTVLLVAFGNRGTVGMMFLYYIFAYIFLNKGKVKIYRIVLLALLAIILMWGYMPILIALKEIIDRFNMNTRFIDMLLSGDVFTSNGRDVITDAVVSMIHQNPYGYGVAADRYNTFAYSHNIILEFCMSYGVLVGSALFIGFVLILLWGYCRSKNYDYHLLAAILICGGGFLKLLMSSSYLIEAQFWLLIGLSLSSIRKNRGAGLK